MGRPKKPNEIKSLQGTDRKDRYVETIDVIKFENINQLKVLKFKGLENANAKRIFNEKANQLILNKMLAPQDVDQLIIYSNAMSIIMECVKNMKKGFFVESFDDMGKLKGYIQNPYLKLFKENSELVIRIGTEFGFSPLSRMKFKPEKPNEVDPLQKLFNEFNN